MTHHPHVHVIVPGGGLSPDGSRWIACRPGFFLPVRVLSRLFRRLFLEGLEALHADGRLVFLGDLAPLERAGSARKRSLAEGVDCARSDRSGNKLRTRPSDPNQPFATRPVG